MYVNYWKCQEYSKLWSLILRYFNIYCCHFSLVSQQRQIVRMNHVSASHNTQNFKNYSHPSSWSLLIGLFFLHLSLLNELPNKFAQLRSVCTANYLLMCSTLNHQQLAFLSGWLRSNIWSKCSSFQWLKHTHAHKGMTNSDFSGTAAGVRIYFSALTI